MLRVPQKEPIWNSPAVRFLRHHVIAKIHTAPPQTSLHPAETPCQVKYDSILKLTPSRGQHSVPAPTKGWSTRNNENGIGIGSKGMQDRMEPHFHLPEPSHANRALGGPLSSPLRCEVCRIYALVHILLLVILADLAGCELAAQVAHLECLRQVVVLRDQDSGSVGVTVRGCGVGDTVWGLVWGTVRNCGFGSRFEGTG